ncbi:MAG: hypothetical protein AB7I57_24340 [Pirellulales bacterium]
MTSTRTSRHGQAAAAWNRRHPIGTLVEYRELKDRGEPQRYRTASHAFLLGGHTAVLQLEGKTGCVALDHCRVVVAGEDWGPDDRVTLTDIGWNAAYAEPKDETEIQR